MKFGRIVAFSAASMTTRIAPRLFHNYFNFAATLSRGLPLALIASAFCASAFGTTFNVMTYGATGTGIIDDTAAIERAITAATKAGAGSVVYLPNGTYLYSTTLTANSITIEGQAEKSTVLLASNNQNSCLTLTGKQPEALDFTIRTVVAPTVRDPNPQGTGIQVLQATGFTISNVAILHVASAGIIVRQSTSASSGAYAEIEACEVGSTLADGINLTQGSSNIEVQGNYVHDTGDDFISVVSYLVDGALSTNMLVHNNTVEHQTNGRGITVVGGSNVRIYNNQISDSVGSGVYIASEANFNTYGVNNVRIFNNVINACPINAIAGHSSMTFVGRVDPANATATDLWVTNIVASDNTISNSTTYGVTVANFASAVTLSLNHIAVSALDGITIQSGCSGIQCLGNTITETNQNGISIQPGATNVQIMADPNTGLGNNISFTAYYGIFMLATASSSTVAIENNIFDSVNQAGTSYVDVICIDGVATDANISVENNQYLNTAGGPVNRMLESIGTPLLAASGNSSPLRFRVYFPSANQLQVPYGRYYPNWIAFKTEFQPVKKYYTVFEFPAKQVRRFTACLSLAFALVTAIAARGQNASLPYNWINVRSVGASGNGTSDDTAAIVAAISQAQSVANGAVYLPAGTYLYSTNIHVNGIPVYGQGSGSTKLVAKDGTHSAWVLSGSSPVLSDLSISSRATPTIRNTSDNATGVAVNAATNFLVQRVRVGQVFSAGIIIRNSGGSSSKYAVIRDSQVLNTMADGIHVTGRSGFVEVSNNQIINTGDDMIAVVSYIADGGLTHDINIFNNVLSNQIGGRGISVVGGTNIQMESNHISHSYDAGIYLASEASYNTFGVSNVAVVGNALTGAVANGDSKQGAIQLLGRTLPGSSGLGIQNIDITRNSIDGASGDGIAIGAYTSNVNLVGNGIANVNGNGVTIHSHTSNIYLGSGTGGSTPNSITASGGHGVLVDPTSSTGSLRITGVIFSNLNALSQNHIDGIYIGRSGGFQSTVITDNQLKQLSGGKLTLFVESLTPVQQFARNTANISIENFLDGQ